MVPEQCRTPQLRCLQRWERVRRIPAVLKAQVAIPVAALIVDLHFQLDGTENHHGNRPLGVFMGKFSSRKTPFEYGQPHPAGEGPRLNKKDPEARTPASFFSCLLRQWVQLPHVHPMASGHDRRLLQTRNQHEDTLPAPFLALLLFGSWSHREKQLMQSI